MDLLDYFEARNGVQLVPLGVVIVLHPGAGHSNVAADRSQLDLVGIAFAGVYGIGLRDFEHAHDFIDQIALFVAVIACVEVSLLPGVQCQPAVAVAVRFPANAIFAAPVRSIHDRACQGYALPVYEQALRVVNVGPKAFIAGYIRLRGWQSSDAGESEESSHAHFEK